MVGEYLFAATLGALVLLLVSAGIEDARTREIANWKNLAIAVLAPAWWVANGLDPWPDMALQLSLGAGVLALFACAFALGQMGGGDVKLLAALALWLPFQPLIWMLVLMSVLGGVLTLLMLIDKWVRRSRAVPEIPYGVAIAIATLLVFREPIFNQFG
ncbi:A24 family peptidase [Stakelama marina]|uniref:Prepilin peptidase n=1 Tax=Stakelama marina TaxID=2826939 RepID=A0A8T4ID04_9SPHN|nr:prepilin peptidase [Stakelama marina]MBR0552363.1 prepilin peptidase [Stakelama marina]